MKWFSAALLCLAFSVMSTQQVFAASIDTPASHAILVDAGTGTVLFDKNANDPMPTSSMSKTMTVYMAFDALKKGRVKLKDKFLVSEKAWRMGGSKMFIREGTQVKLEDLLRGIIVQSGNDAAVAVAEGLAGTEAAFAEEMNAKAKEIGMSSSNFMNASGWPHPEHYSTARDLSVLAYRIIYDFPEYYPYFSETEFTYNKIKQANRDPLLGKLRGADGLKTGHTDAAGYGLIGSAVREGERRLILVVNGLKSERQREEESIRLLEWGFRNFNNVRLISAQETIDKAKVWLGQKTMVPLVAAENLDVVLPSSGRADLKLAVAYNEPLKAPVKKGDKVAKLTIEIPAQPPVQMDLLAGETIGQDGAWGRALGRLSYLLTKEY